MSAALLRVAPSARACRGMLGMALIALALVAPLPGEEPEKAPPGSADRTTLEARFTDDSVMKVALLDQQVTLVTPYGTLRIPVRDIQRIEFGTHISAETARRIETAIGKLGSPDFHERETAGEQLLALREKAYPTLQEAARSSDPEVARRANEMLEKLRASVPADQLAFRKNDVIHTADSQLAGQIEQAALKARTGPFGEVELKLTDLRSLHAGKIASRAVAALPDPGTLTNFQQHLGESFYFRVTGANAGSVWGTDVYTTDSSLATAAVHMGVLAVGQTGVVKVTILPSPPMFQGSQRNGITTSGWGMFPAAFQVSAVEGGVTVQDAPPPPGGAPAVPR